MNQVRRHTLPVLLCAAFLIGAALPGEAEAHGPVAPVASSFLARVSDVPPGLQAEVIDGDQRMWLRSPPSETVVVLDYRGAPYARFSAAGVEVNQSSAMYFLNQTPVAETPPANLSRSTPPHWQRVTGSHGYAWHDGRLHALAGVAISPGVSYVGRWSIPVLVNGRLRQITGGVWHAAAPSIVWFWPIAVLLACVLAGLRVRNAALDALSARATALAALVAIVAAGVGRQLHGRPDVSVFQLVELGGILAFAGWGGVRVLFGRPRYFTFFVIAFVALWEGLELIPTLLHGFVLLAVPAWLARVATVLCLGCGAALLLLTVRLAEQPEAGPAPSREPAIAFDSEDQGITENLV